MLKRLLAALLTGVLLLGLPAWAGSEGATQASPAEAGPEVSPSPKPASGYVLVSTATQSGWLPLPESGEVSYPLRQVLPDGTEAVNTIHLTPEGVFMEDSTCANHDCVQQGEVTLENRRERILGNMIICLPNQVCLQLFTPEELLEMTKGEENP